MDRPDSYYPPDGYFSIELSGVPPAPSVLPVLGILAAVIILGIIIAKKE